MEQKKRGRIEDADHVGRQIGGGGRDAGRGVDLGVVEGQLGGHDHRADHEGGEGDVANGVVALAFVHLHHHRHRHRHHHRHRHRHHRHVLFLLLVSLVNRELATIVNKSMVH